jgi:hypothetical protein
LEGGPPSFPQDFSCPAVLGIPLGAVDVHLPGCHRLWRAVPGRFGLVSCIPCCGPTTPPEQAPTVWAVPRSLAATEGIAVAFSSSGYLDVSVPRVGSSCEVTRVAPRWVAPFGDPGITACVQLPQAYRSLPRPSSPLGAKASTVRPLLLDLMNSHDQETRTR